MTASGARGRSWSVDRRCLALGLALALAAPVRDLAAAPADPAPSRPAKVFTIYHKSRSFRIPFNVDADDRPRLKEVQLCVSEDLGETWRIVSRTTPDRPAFTFRAGRDAEYWFAVRTIDTKGQVYPAEEKTVEPSMKVVVDTVAPSLVVEPDPRRASVGSVRWEVRDENLDLKSLVLEYQVEGGRDWRRVPIRRPSLIGSERWDAGTAEPLKVRASIADKAGNVAEQVLTLPEGTPVDPDRFPGDLTPPGVAQISSGPSAPGSDDPAPGAPAADDPFPYPAPQSPAPADGEGGGPALPNFGGEPDPPAPTPAPQPTAETPADEPEPADTPERSPSAGATGASPTAGSIPVVSSPKFPLQYAVEDAGPGGPAKVELWATPDGGRHWYRQGEDPDHASPFPVDLGGEGTFGLRVVSHSASGLGDPPPGPGDKPDLSVIVDSTRPAVQLYPLTPGTGPTSGQLLIRWQAGDAHLAARPIRLSWRPEQPGTRWQPITPDPVANTGQYIWAVPTNAPARIHVRVDAIDQAGNRAYADTTAGPAVAVKLRPRTRIIGLDLGPQAGLNPAARPRR